MPKKDYRNVCIPSSIYLALSEIVEDDGSLYVSVSDLVKETLREKISDIRKETIAPGRKSHGNGDSR
jgi:hypothetical protein